MSSAGRWLTTVAGMGAIALGWAGPLRAESILCTPIPAVPFTIDTRGVYCLDRVVKFSADTTGGAAITVKADHVVVDLNGFTLQGLVGSPGPGPVPTVAVGIYAFDRSHVTVKNGTIRGFRRCVLLEGMGGGTEGEQGHVVEGVNVDGCTHEGIAVEGSGSIVRKNRVLATGGDPTVESHGIRVKGLRPQVVDNEVTRTYGGFGGDGHGIHVDAAGAVVEGNRVGNDAQTVSSSFGIVLLGPDALVVGNRLTVLDQGIFFTSQANGKYRDNLASGVANPYSGGTDAGNNQ